MECHFLSYVLLLNALEEKQKEKIYVPLFWYIFMPCRLNEDDSYLRYAFSLRRLIWVYTVCLDPKKGRQAYMG